MTESFWSARPVLEHVLAAARARGVGPWALLGAALARAVATVPAEITLPGIVGSRMSLNLFVALVGPSGGGKGAAEAAAIDAFRFATDIETVPLGSGEGIARTFRPVGTNADDPNPVSAAFFTAPEIDTLSTITGRQGSSLSAELRKMYSGEQLGFGNAGRDTRVIVPPGSYRACLSIGVQPLRSQALLDAADGGLPQRFVWLPTSDPDALDEPPEHPGTWKVSRPSWLRAIGTHLDLNVPDVAWTAIRAHRLSVLREEPGVDPLDGHSLLTRLKAAAALMALEGRTVVSDADWSLAGYLLDVSAFTRERCRRALTEQYRSANTARALATAEREEIISDRKVQRCKDGILRRLDRHGGAPVQQRELRRGLKSDIRDNFDAAATELIAEELIFAGHDGRAETYAQSTWTDTSTCPDLRKERVDPTVHVDRQPAGRRHRTRGKHRTQQQTDLAERKSS